MKSTKTLKSIKSQRTFQIKTNSKRERKRRHFPTFSAIFLTLRTRKSKSQQASFFTTSKLGSISARHDDRQLLRKWGSNGEIILVCNAGNVGNVGNGLDALAFRGPSLCCPDNEDIIKHGLNKASATLSATAFNDLQLCIRIAYFQLKHNLIFFHFPLLDFHNQIKGSDGFPCGGLLINRLAIFETE